MIDGNKLIADIRAHKPNAQGSGSTYDAGFEAGFTQAMGVAVFLVQEHMRGNTSK